MRKQNLSVVALAVSIAAAMGLPNVTFAQKASTQAAASCPRGKITCFEWCKKYRPTSTTCLSGRPESCDKLVGGNNACVSPAPTTRPYQGRPQLPKLQKV